MFGFFRKLKRIVVGVILCAVGYGLYKLLNTDRAQESLFDLLGEDNYLNILDTVRLVGDLLGWPVEFIRALLP